MKKRTNYILIIMSICCSIGFSHAQNHSYSDFDSFFNDFAKTIATDQIQNTRSMLQLYCSSLFSHDVLRFHQHENGFYYDATQSNFMYILCNQAVGGDYFDALLTGDEAIIQRHNRTDYNIECNPSTDMDSCSFHKELSDTFNRLINEYTNIVLGASYGVTDTSKSNNDLANEFSKQYFSDTVLCDPKDPKDNLCRYPQTFEHLKSFIRQGKTLIKKSSLIDHEKLGEHKAKQEQCEMRYNPNLDTNYSILTCGLAGSQINTKTTRNTQLKPKNFANLLYNEFFWYSAFMDYYQKTLLNNLKLQPYKITDNTGKFFRQAQQQATFIQLSTQRSLFAIEKTIEQLQLIQGKFAIHIGFMMYYERLVELRKSLAKIYTPIHQLYYKLRNVQVAQ